MKKRLIKLTALLMAALLLAGCSQETQEQLNKLRQWDPMAELKAYIDDALDVGEEPAEDSGEDDSVIAFTDMEYERPDMDAIQEGLDAVCTAAQGDEFRAILRRINSFYDLYDAFYTNYSLADIHYSADLSDSYWEAEYNYCLDQSAQVDAALEEMYYALAKSPCLEELEGEAYFGEGYFDSYQGENMWDENFTALMEKEGQLKARYYELSSQGAEYEEGSEDYYSACGNEMAELMVELIRVRQEMADYWGYSDYAQFATDFYYYRDYTVDQSRKYLEAIQQELVPLYIQLNEKGRWFDGFTYCTEEQTYAYVQEMSRNMGGVVEEAFDLMDRGGLYDIGYGENKYASSFEVYLTSYYEPFIFMCPEMSTYDYLTFAHEFGHFCNDYASYGSYAGVDVLEFFSQGMEYLSLCYVDGTENLTELKMADSLSLYVEQSAFASFEMKMYELTGDELTVENLYALYEETASAYGFESVGYDPREFVTINHFFTNPMYILSYVVSNDAAMQLYQMEMETAGAGLDCFERNISTGESYFLSFLDSAGLESPFAQGRIQSVRKTFEDILG